jgi:hypothetical protein
MRGWTLHLDGERPWEIDPRDHDVAVRTAQAAGDGLDLALVAPSAVLGIDRLAPDEAAALAAAWHDGALALPAPFRPWATAGVRDPDPAALADALASGAVGLELAADVLATPRGVEELSPLLAVLEELGRPLLVHPGPGGAEDADGRPRWWCPVVTYTAQLQAAWWAWIVAGRDAFPELRVCFAALAGLAPIHAERHRSRGGTPAPVDPLMFVETSTYGSKAIDATVRVLGVDVVCHGSDRPYAPPPEPGLGSAVDHAFRVRNPGRLLAPVIQEVTA